MRRRNWLLLVTVASISAAALVACSDDDGGGESPADSGTDAAADHAVKDSSTAPDTSPNGDGDTGGGNNPDTSTPDSNVADSNVADTSAPDGSVADSSVADTSVADTSVADTSVADTSVPDTSVAPDAAVDPCPATGTYVTHTLEFSFATTKVVDGGKGQTLTINHCDSVIWHNADTVTHGVESTSGPTTFNTGNFAGGAMSAPVQFPTAGTEDFRCTIHTASMRGELTIQ